MIFAKLTYDMQYDDVHQKLVDCLAPRFPYLQYGHQGDSWVWITEGEQKVEIDTFYAMYHQVRSASDTPLVWSVIEQLDIDFQLELIDPPEEEATDSLYSD